MRSVPNWPILMVGLALALSGCDTAAPGAESIFLTFETGSGGARFAFEGSSTQTGRLVDLSCDCEYGVDDFLAAQGFSPSEIVSASVESVSLRSIFPIGAHLGYLSTAILKLDTPTLSSLEVAESTSLGTESVAELMVRAGRDISSYLERGAFSPILQIDANALDPLESYELAVVFSLRIEVEGF